MLLNVVCFLSLGVCGLIVSLCSGCVSLVMSVLCVGVMCASGCYSKSSVLYYL